MKLRTEKMLSSQRICQISIHTSACNILSLVGCSDLYARAGPFRQPSMVRANGLMKIRTALPNETFE